MDRIAPPGQTHVADDAFELLKEELDPAIAVQNEAGMFEYDFDQLTSLLEAVETIEAACAEFARSVNQTAARMEAAVAMIETLAPRDRELGVG